MQKTNLKRTKYTSKSNDHFLIAANWKMYKNPTDTEKFLIDFLKLQATFSNRVRNIFFVPAINLLSAAKVLAGTNVQWGAQNIYSEVEGAYTGENSPKVLKEIGAQVCLVGHSERRSLFHETNETCAKKIKAAQDLGLEPMLCVGENLDQRNSGKTFDVITTQLKDSLQLSNVNKKLFIAYEPVWAIGTGQVASCAQANEAHLILRMALSELRGEVFAEATPILYGGSVKPENAQELADEDQIDGFLIGGASLKVESLSQISQVKLG